MCDDDEIDIGDGDDNDDSDDDDDDDDDGDDGGDDDGAIDGVDMNELKSLPVSFAASRHPITKVYKRSKSICRRKSIFMVDCVLF